MKSMRLKIAARRAHFRHDTLAPSSLKFSRNWQAAVGKISSPVFVHRAFSVSSSSQSPSSVIGSIDATLPKGSCVAAVELDSPSVLCGADYGGVRGGVFRTAMLMTNQVIASPTPMQFGLIDSPEIPSADLLPGPDPLAENLFRALDEVCGVTTVEAKSRLSQRPQRHQQQQQQQQRLEFNLRCFCLACTYCHALDHADEISSWHSLFWATRVTDLPAPDVAAHGGADGQKSGRLAAAYHALLSSDSGSRLAGEVLPSPARLAAAWRMIRCLTLTLREGERMIPVAAPVISSHFLRSSRDEKASKEVKKQSGWKGFQKAAMQKNLLQCNVQLQPAREFASSSTDCLVRVSSIESSMRESNSASDSSERLFLTLTTAEEKTVVKRDVPCSVEILE